MSSWLAGAARRVITPPPGVELAGLGYYLERKWQRVANDLNATALVIALADSSRSPDPKQSIVLLALDLMYNSAELTAAIRHQVQTATGIPHDHICVNVSHSHCAPTAGLIRGAGEVDDKYIAWVACQASDAAREAWSSLHPVRLSAGESQLHDMTFNRTRENGPVNPTVGVLRVDALDGSPVAVAINFHSHCTAYMECDLFAVGRDWPGDVVDQVESTITNTNTSSLRPSALYLQGVCGDVNFRREYNATERRSEPGRALARAAMEAWNAATELLPTSVSSALHAAQLPTRPWTADEIESVRRECEHRLATGDTTGWLDGFAKNIVNQPERLPLRYGGSVDKAVTAIARFGLEWATAVGRTFVSGHEDPSGPHFVSAEVQAIRIGNLFIATCPGELFTSLGLELRKRWTTYCATNPALAGSQLFILAFTNGSIGYIPDAYDVQRGSYAALQSPKFTGQQPFTAEAGTALIDTMFAALQQTASSSKTGVTPNAKA